MPEIRVAKYDDLPLILDIYNDAVLHSTATFDTTTQTLEERQRWFNEHNPASFPIVCLVDGDHILGWGSLSPYRPRYAYRFTVEFSVYLAKEHCGRGYGRQMLTYLIEQAQEIGYHSVIGCIESSNIASLELAYALGFTHSGELMEVGYKFDRWLNVTFVQKML
jgi:L-amino acid N-acyltransferase